LRLDTGLWPDIRRIVAIPHFDFDEVEVVNNRPMNIWLYAKCRTYINPDNPEKDKALSDAEVEITGDYDGNPT
jgi:hypothetical protein